MGAMGDIDRDSTKFKPLVELDVIIPHSIFISLSATIIMVQVETKIYGDRDVCNV